MAKLGKVLESQFKKLGIEVSDELKAFLELDNELPDDIASKIDKGLLTIEAAKTNPDINKILKQSILAGIDTKIEAIIKDMGLTVDEDFANEKNSYEKVSKLSAIIHNHGQKKGEANSKEGLSETVKKEREDFIKKEADYQRQLKELTEGIAAKETNFTATRESDLTSFEIQKLLLGKDYVFPKEMDSMLKVQTAQSAINKDLTAKGYIIKRDDAGSLVLTDKDGNPAYNDKHEKIVNPNHYFDAVLTHNKLLNINDPNVQKQTPGSPGAGGVILPAAATGNQTVMNEIQAQLDGLK